jgi:6-phosphogluconolactonase
VTRLAYVGCRTTRARNARGEGLAVFRAGHGGWERIQLLTGLENPSFLAFGREGRVLYAVHGDGEEASAFRIGAEGLLAPINRAPTGGRNPVHLTVAPDGRHLLVANHATSGIALLRLDGDGAIGGIADLVELRGEPGPHRIEQPHAKPHQLRFDPAGRVLHVPDKGLDRVLAYRLDAAAGRLEPLHALATRAGAGPRHMAFRADGRIAYVLNELDSTVLACRYEAAGGVLAPFQLLPTLPDDFTGESRAAEIAVSADGGTVYASNRGHDSIAVFAADPVTGHLSPLHWVAAGGRTPRHFALDPEGRHLFAASEADDVVHAFAVEAGGRLRPAGAVAETGSPVCILLADIPHPPGRS